jgi:hypothetical protein
LSSKTVDTNPILLQHHNILKQSRDKKGEFPSRLLAH